MIVGRNLATDCAPIVSIGTRFYRRTDRVMDQNRAKFAALAVIAALTVLLAACGGTMPTPLPTAMPNQISQQASGGNPATGYQVVMVQSVITVGPNRFAIGLLEGDAF